MKKSQFLAETTLINIMNSVKRVGELNIACVMWHTNPWKVVEENDFNIVADRFYSPVAEFRTREELWKFIKQNYV